MSDLDFRPFRHFVHEMTQLVRKAGLDEPEVMAEASRLLVALVIEDVWLPDRFAEPHPEHYQQYLLHCDPEERFSVVSFVWGPSQKTPIHDHTVWGLVGIMRGAEIGRKFEQPDGDGPLKLTGIEEFLPGEVDRVSPRIGDIHEVSNKFDDRVSISIHVYGANIGAVRRHVFHPETGAPKTFVSGYASEIMPNWWDRSKELRKTM